MIRAQLLMILEGRPDRPTSRPITFSPENVTCMLEAINTCGKFRVCMTLIHTNEYPDLRIFSQNSI